MELRHKMWLWGLGEDIPRWPTVELDYKATSVSSWRLSETGENAGIDGQIVFSAGRYKLHRVDSCQMLIAGAVALVKGQVLEVLKRLPSSDVDFYDTIIRCADGFSHNFSMVRPKVESACTDTVRSNVKWERVNEFYVMWKRLELVPGCLNGHSLVRDKYNRQMIISDELMTTISEIEPRARGYFIKPEESRRGYAPWVE